MTRVSFPGSRGAYGESAARSFFNELITTMPAETFSGALRMAEDGESKYAVIPIENMLEGVVGQSYDLLLSTPLLVAGEVYHPIRHCLIGLGKIGQANTVYSHPQALEQCREFIESHGLRRMAASSTADSVKIVRDLNRVDTVCIASEAASEIYGVPVMFREISDHQRNYTRFFLMSKDMADPAKRNKTSLVVSVRDEPGALHDILVHFLEHGINITNMASRPRRTGTWEYNFFIDFEGHSRNGNVQEMISEIERRTDFLKLLGSYPAAPAP
ncbi:MAG: prephenate dehydratase [Nitrosopumilaceae archaeon]|nr:prephenate dehydratase [Nitrosopumilaceae archaeon]